MTLQRFDFYADPVDPIPMIGGRYVLAAEAEAAIEKWRSLCWMQGKSYDEGFEDGRDEAIHDAAQRVMTLLNRQPIEPKWMRAKIIDVIKGEL